MQESAKNTVFSRMRPRRGRGESKSLRFWRPGTAPGKAAGLRAATAFGDAPGEAKGAQGSGRLSRGMALLRAFGPEKACTELRIYRIYPGGWRRTSRQGDALTARLL